MTHSQKIKKGDNVAHRNTQLLYRVQEVKKGGWLKVQPFENLPGSLPSMTYVSDCTYSVRTSAVILANEGGE